MSQPSDDWSSLAPPPDDRQPPPHGTPYGQPPQQGQGPYAGQWGYGPPGNPGQPRTEPVRDDTIWAMFCYVGTLVAGFIAPLVIYFVKRNESGFVRFHAAQALNYAITQFCILLLVMVPTITLAIVLDTPAILIILAPLVLFEIISQYVYLILGSIRSARGEWYRLPSWICWRMIR